MNGGMPDENEAGRLSRALRAHLRQECVSPAAAIVGFAEIALDEIDRLGLTDYREDLERIVNAGFSLQRRLNDALLKAKVKYTIVAGKVVYEAK